MRKRTLAAGVLALCVAYGALGFGYGRTTAHTRTIAKQPPAEVISVINRPHSGISSATIKKDIPAWEAAANGAFSHVWDTRQVKIRLVPRAPKTGVVAIFQNKGNVKGALAYHTMVDGYPRIIVYSGTGNFYGYNNSVSFTHELFEYLADPTISVGQQGWPNPTIWIGNNHPIFLGIYGEFWINETCDPVEAYAYTVKGVQISDWITPNWFDTRSHGAFDYMGKIHEPLMILKGGYAQFWYGQWYAILNFGHHDANRGFFLGESDQGRGKVTVLDKPAKLVVKRDGRLAVG